MKRFLFPIIFLCSLSAIAQETSLEDRLKDAHRGFWDQFPRTEHGVIVSPRVLTMFTGKTAYAEVSLAEKPSEPVNIEIWDWSYLYDYETIRNVVNRERIPTFTFFDTLVPSFSPKSMVFTPDNWNIPQKIMVTAPLTPERGINTKLEHFYTILFRIDGVQKASWLLINIQNPPSETTIVPSTTSLRVDEGGSTSFEVKLSKAPANKAHYAAVDIMSDNPYVRLEPRRLYFHPGIREADEWWNRIPPWNLWSEPQTVQVFVDHDADAESERSTITLGVREIGDQFLYSNHSNPDDWNLEMPAPSIIAPDETISLDVIDDERDDPLQRMRLILSDRSMTIEEGDSKSFSVQLDDLPTSEVRVNLSSDNLDVTISPRSLIIYPSIWSVPQSVSVSAKVDSDSNDDRSSIFLNSHGGGAISREKISILVKDNHPTASTQVWGDIVISPDEPLPIDEGKSGVVFISLSDRPNADVTVDVSSDNPILTLSADRMTFDTSNWRQPQAIAIGAKENSDPKTEYGSVFMTASGGITAPRKRLSVVVIDNDPPPYSEVRSQSLALPSSASRDSATLRVQCKQDSPCPVSLDCSTQDGTVFRGELPEPIAPWETRSLDMVDIERYTGGFSWSGKGRLGCSLLSTGNISSQIWTRSGNGVLVNNSAAVRSTLIAPGLFQADIESIPSPDSPEESNIRLRCTSPIQACINTHVNCYDDSGKKYSGSVGAIEPLATRHIQTEELASLIGYRWKGLALSCEFHSSNQFTAQVLTRTGGGGGLVNNSASSNLAQ
ncbi:hypothetical protein [Thioalkalivibrio sp. HK1]|uniref:hypothetical protein n=1 Tax=Thioalkalivibrio sp. HK1 TaxID=1469245 RepID=UPI00046E718E|nr:hypothetical protein [Thioalkalivibrio sp. HK1]